MLSGLQHRDEANEAMKAAGECRARARNPSPPKLGLSCVCCQLESGNIRLNARGEAQPYLFI